MTIDCSKAGPQRENINLSSWKDEPVSLHDAIEAFRHVMTEHGLEPGSIVPDTDDMQRFDIEPGDGAGWYKIHTDGIPAGIFGNWKTDLSTTWCFKKQTEVTPEAWATHKARIEENKRQAKARTNAKYEKAAIEHGKAFEAAGPTSPNHPYLVKKQIGIHGDIRQDGDVLFIPLYDENFKFWTYQEIYPEKRKFKSGDRDKNFPYGGKKQGNFLTIPGNEKVFICEGYSTGASIHAATGGTVVIAFDAGNIIHVARKIKDRFPASSITIAGDDDRFKPVNTGRVQAEKAAQELGLKLIFPEFESLGTQPTDFNDLAGLEGVEAVRLQIYGRSDRLDIFSWSAERFDGDPPGREWLVRHTIPMGAVTVLAAMGDAGKGMLSLDLALKVASKARPGLNFPTAFDNIIDKGGTAVIFAAEDTKNEIHRRLNDLDVDNVRSDPDLAKKLLIIPLPNAGGPAPIVSPGSNGPEATAKYQEIREQLLSIKDLALIVFDPLASFVTADINSDPAAGAFTMGLLSSLATETGAAVVLCHHMGKTGMDKAIKTSQQARSMIRGTTAIVDGVRAAYCLWPADKDGSKTVCEQLKEKWEENKVYKGALVKSNGPGDRMVKTFVRAAYGLLVPRTNDIEKSKAGVSEILQALAMEIKEKAAAGHPYTQQGTDSGLYVRRHQFGSKIIKKVGRDRLVKYAKILEADQTIFACRAKGSSKYQWLDVKDGQFFRGEGVIEKGAFSE